jgi:CYTH domain-containing protein
VRRVGIEREIRYVVEDGVPPPGGRHMVQAYFLRGRISLRVRLVDDREGSVTLKAPRAEGRREWERPVPGALARRLVALPLPRVEKERRREGELEVDAYAWPARLVVCECELAQGVGPDLRDRAARARWMEARRPAWVRAWRDVTDDPSFTAAALARRRPRAESR